MIIPQSINQNGKEYLFTGDFEILSTGGRRAAARNRKTVKVPLYKTTDGEPMLAMWLQQKP